MHRDFVCSFLVSAWKLSRSAGKLVKTTYSKTMSLWIIIKGERSIHFASWSVHQMGMLENNLVHLLNDVNVQYDLYIEMHCWSRKDVTHWNGMPLFMGKYTHRKKQRKDKFFFVAKSAELFCCKIQPKQLWWRTQYNCCLRFSCVEPKKVRNTKC